MFGAVLLFAAIAFYIAYVTHSETVKCICLALAFGVLFYFLFIP